MHITITNNSGDVVSSICIDRDTKHCQIIHCLPDLIGQATAIARSTGVSRVYVIVESPEEEEEYGSVGFQQADDVMVMVRKFDG